jgi:hypothetical protein
MPEHIHLVNTALLQLAIRLVESMESRIWRYHSPELIECNYSGMLLKERCYPVQPMLKHPQIEDMKYILYNNSYQTDAWYFPEDYI